MKVCFVWNLFYWFNSCIVFSSQHAVIVAKNFQTLIFAVACKVYTGLRRTFCCCLCSAMRIFFPFFALQTHNFIFKFSWSSRVFLDRHSSFFTVDFRWNLLSFMLIVFSQLHLWLECHKGFEESDGLQLLNLSYLLIKVVSRFILQVRNVIKPLHLAQS